MLLFIAIACFSVHSPIKLVVDYFGCTIGFSNFTVMVGASGTDEGGFNSGTVYVFNASENLYDPELSFQPLVQWSQQQKIRVKNQRPNDNFGQILNLYNDTLLITSIYDDTYGTKSGSVYVFSISEGLWSQQQQLSPAGGGGVLQFGAHITQYGAHAAISPFSSGQANVPGVVYMFSKSYSGTSIGQSLSVTHHDPCAPA